MRLDYGTQLSPEPIRLTISTLRKPTLREIAKLNFDKFAMFEMFLKMTPELFYTKIKADEGKAYWESLSETQRYDITLFDLIVNDISLQMKYEEILNFFFEETVAYKDGMFILFNIEKDATEVSLSDVCGVLRKETFPEIVDLIQQICFINISDENPENQKFKNKIARKLFDRMEQARKEEQVRSKADMNLTLPNLISAVSNMHPSISPFNVWDLTIFQLLDAFRRINDKTMFEIDRTRVSVWGDEKKTFDAALWYKNGYDTKG